MNQYVNPNTWHENIRKARKDQRITQQEMAQRTNIRQSRISQIENGQVDPKLSEIVSVSENLGSVLVQVPYAILPSIEEVTREYERQSKDRRARTIPELILGNRVIT